MGWNLAYDCIRDWLFSNHRANFNASLVATYQRKGQPKYEPIASYDDFFSKDAPAEREVLDTAKDCRASAAGSMTTFANICGIATTRLTPPTRF